MASRPTPADDRTMRLFERFDLSRVFGDLEGFAAARRAQAARAHEAAVEAERRRPGRHDGSAPGTEPTLTAGVTLARHNAWVREDLEGTVWYSNLGPDAHEALLRWRIPGHAGAEGEWPLSIRPFTSGPLKYGPHLRIEAPDVESPARATLEITLEVDGRVLATRSEALTVTPWDATAIAPAEPVTLRGDARILEAGLLEAGFRLEEAPEPAGLLVTTTLDAEARAHLAADGAVLLLAETPDPAADMAPLAFRPAPAGAIGFVQRGVFGDLPVAGVMGPAFEDLWPQQVLTLSGESAPAEVLAGLVEGELEAVGGVLVRLKLPQGRLTVTTLRLVEAYGLQPVGTAMAHRLAALCAAETTAAI